LCAPPREKVARDGQAQHLLPSIGRMSVIGTGGAECADAQPASRVAVSTIRTAMLINRGGFMWHNLAWEKELHLEAELPTGRVLGTIGVVEGLTNH